ncbi:hypothetical protein L1987_54264 [Smallanthus sonchifolius]|uniref:Uncharacterized protein n=1 Tax=Smallanthus sonchifolius TaxID=185202 RepID=A0ACB9E718_9ASTR|nr:hypothetical protein L1987_54264 [Smallanthus sonchifolius]
MATGRVLDGFRAHHPSLNRSHGVFSVAQTDLASKLIGRNSNYVVSKDKALMAMARTFPSRLGFWETLIYPRWDSTSEMIVNRTKTFFSFQDGSIFANVEVCTSFVENFGLHIASILNYTTSNCDGLLDV